jgi:hypothetical protein
MSYEHAPLRRLSIKRVSHGHLMGVHLTVVHHIGVYLAGVTYNSQAWICVGLIGGHLTGVCLMGMHLTGVCLMGIHLMGIHLIGGDCMETGY